GGCVCPYCDANDNPNLVIRVYRSATEALLQPHGLEVDEFLWLPSSVLNEQLYVVKKRAKLPHPLDPPQE
ncbi:hypothetical protein H4R33_006597, partial [Dimargaris cristalligena]